MFDTVWQGSIEGGGPPKGCTTQRQAWSASRNSHPSWTCRATALPTAEEYLRSDCTEQTCAGLGLTCAHCKAVLGCRLRADLHVPNWGPELKEGQLSADSGTRRPGGVRGWSPTDPRPARHWDTISIPSVSLRTGLRVGGGMIHLATNGCINISSGSIVTFKLKKILRDRGALTACCAPWIRGLDS